MLQNYRVIAFTILELFRESQLGGGGRITLSPPPHTHPPRQGLRQYYKDKPSLINAGISVSFNAANNSALFKFKQKAIGSTGDGGKNLTVKIMVSLE